MVRLSALPQGLPPEAHLHKLNFKLPYTLVTEPHLADITGQTVESGNTIWKLIYDLIGPECVQGLIREYGGRRGYQTYFTIRNEQNDVLISIFTDGTGTVKNTTSVSFNGLCWETWSALNPLPHLQVGTIADYVFDRGGWFTRVDLAKNDYRRVTDWKDAVAASHKDAYRDRIILRLCRTKPPLFMRSDSESIYYGSNKSRTQVLAYVKSDAELTKFPWTRFEVILRGKSQCNDAIRKLRDGTDISTLTSGVLGHLLDFKIQSITTKGKRPTCQWWTDFVGTEKIKLSTKEDNQEEHLDGVDF